MTFSSRNLAVAAAAAALLVSLASGATVDVGWDASTQADGALNSWDASPNSFSPREMMWNGSGTKASGTSNFANINDWVNSPDYDFVSGASDSWQAANPDPTSTNASWEFVFRPGDFTGNHHLFNSGGNGAGLAFLLEGSTLRFVFQQANADDQRIELTTDLSAIGAATDFFHIVGTTDVDTATTGIGQLWVNSTSVAGPTTSAGTIDDWDGGDLASLGSGT